MSDDRPVGVFDSGLGGLTVLAELVRRLPQEDFIYLGDTARVPYGSRSPRVVRRYSQEAADYLIRQDIKFLVIACNTATAHAAESLAGRLPVEILGVIEPGVEALLEKSDQERVGVIGTRSTIKSCAYETAIRTRQPELTVFSRACPLFVPLVEESWVDKKITSLVIQEYLSEMIREEVTTVILGCTHYPVLKEAISREYPQLRLIDSSVETARAVEKRIAELNLRNEANRKGGVRILLTDLTDQMESLERLFLGLTFDSVEEVRLVESL